MARLENMMSIPLSELPPHLQEIVSEVEREGRTVEVERDGQIVARIVPAAMKRVRPWRRSAEAPCSWAIRKNRCGTQIPGVRAKASVEAAARHSHLDLVVHGE